MFSFPCFRSDEWMKRVFDKCGPCPSAVLESVDLTPEYVKNNPTAQLQVAKVS